VNGALRRALLLDTSAFITGYEAADVNMEHYSVPAVREELREGEFSKLRFDNAVRVGNLKVVHPDLMYVAEIGKVATEMGEGGVLSEADTHLLALGLQLIAEGFEAIIVSDDYSIQNIADRLGMRFKSLATSGIKRRFEWTIYCPGCRRTFGTPQLEDVCPICGTRLRRRPWKKSKVGEQIGFL
jgi:UPF0271 protein